MTRRTNRLSLMTLQLTNRVNQRNHKIAISPTLRRPRNHLLTMSHAPNQNTTRHTSRNISRSQHNRKVLTNSRIPVSRSHQRRRHTLLPPHALTARFNFRRRQGLLHPHLTRSQLLLINRTNSTTAHSRQQSVITHNQHRHNQTITRNHRRTNPTILNSRRPHRHQVTQRIRRNTLTTSSSSHIIYPKHSVLHPRNNHRPTRHLNIKLRHTSIIIIKVRTTRVRHTTNQTHSVNRSTIITGNRPNLKRFISIRTKANLTHVATFTTSSRRRKQYIKHIKQPHNRQQLTNTRNRRRRNRRSVRQGTPINIIQ